MALVGKNNSHSVLDEDASIYQIQEEKSEKQKWSELDSSQRLHYFIDYYLLKCLICITAVAVAGMFIWNIVKPKKERMIFITVVENSLIPEGKEHLEQQLTEMFITDPDKQEIRIDDTFPAGYESDAKLSAYMNAQEIDLLITNENRFQELAKTECYEDLNEILPELTRKYPELLCRAEGYTEEDSDSSHESDASKAFGINITACHAFRETWFSEEKAVIGIIRNSQQKENAKKVLTELFFH